MMAYSVDLRERAITFIGNGGRINEAIKVFGVSRTTLNRWLEKVKRGEDLKDPPPKRPWKKIDPDKLMSLVQKNADWTLAQFGEAMGVSANSIHNAFNRLKITRKKSPYFTKSAIQKNVKHFYSQSRKLLPKT
jgi:transposase